MANALPLIMVSGSEPGIIWMRDMSASYSALVDLVRRDGRHVAPRGKRTRELLDQTIVFESIDQMMMPIGIGRKINPAIGAVEAIQLIAALETPAVIARISPPMMAYAEPDGYFHGAYGRRIGIQAYEVWSKLRGDPDTRQAQITLWDPREDNSTGKRDYPCTLALSFRIRNSKLELHTTMRSNDVWRGFAYDAFQFTQLQWTIANALGIEPGRYIHTAHSLHIYDDDLAAADELHASSSELVWYPTGVPIDNHSLWYKTAGQILLNTWEGEPPPSAAWYLRHLHQEQE